MKLKIALTGLLIVFATASPTPDVANGTARAAARERSGVSLSEGPEETAANRRPRARDVANGTARAAARERSGVSLSQGPEGTAAKRRPRAPETDGNWRVFGR